MLLALLPTERSDALRLEAFTEANIGPFAMAWSNRELIMQVEQVRVRANCDVEFALVGLDISFPEGKP